MFRNQLIVRTKLGGLQGKIDTASDGKQFYTFHGIPFATPPVGELRFKAPRPPIPWSGVLDATIEGDECYSNHQILQTRVGSENCLTLNVFTHSTIQGVRKPVMVWFHGGAFTLGSSKVELFGPSFLMCEDIVLVTVNYRLGIFGFLAFNDKSLRIPGNAGLKDQVMALHWVQSNIDCFGGDPNNVTLFGESAGGASINYLLCSPMARGLFHKVIIQSGSALNTWAKGQVLPEGIVNFFKMEGKTEAEIYHRLMAATKEELLSAQYACKDPFSVRHPRPFAPVIEGFNPHEVSFLLNDPLTIMKSGNYIKVPMIIGYNTHEGMLLETMGARLKLRTIIRDFEKCVPFKYNLQNGSKMLKAIGDKIKAFYYGASDSESVESRLCYRDLQTDNYLLREIYIGLQTMLASNPHAIYFYRFAFDGELSVLKRFADIQEEGACHADDIFYIFKTAISPEVKANSREQRTIQRLIKLWTNFAKTSDPNPSKPDELLNAVWPKTDGKKLLNIGDELQIIDFPEIDRMRFWEKIDIITNNKL